MSGTRSTVRGHSLGYSRGCGQGNDISLHETGHESHVQKENREEHNGENQVDLEEVDLR